MKKIIALLVFTLAFSINANAQQKRPVKPAASTTTTAKADDAPTDFKTAARNDVAALSKVVAFTGTQEQDFYNLFKYKHEVMAADITQERRDNLSMSIEAKLRAGLTPEDMKKLESDPALLKKLTH